MEQWDTGMVITDHDLTLTRRRKRLSIAQICEWMKQTCDNIRAEIVVKSIKMCGISNALNGTEDDALFNDDDCSTENEYQCFDNEGVIWI